MAVKLFILGLPGSGKSTVFRHIENYVKKQHRKSIRRISDYEILYGMYVSGKLKNEDERKFEETEEHNGFDIKVFSVLDDSLKIIYEKAKKLSEPSSKEELIVIEFARKDYKQAFWHFNNHDFFRDAYILYLDVDISTCQQRVNKRVLNRKTLDDHFVSERIFNSYYQEDSKHYIISGFREDYEIDEDRVKVLDNKGSEKDFVLEVNQFIDFILVREENRSNGTASS
jgi:thymidylate kinase